MNSENQLKLVCDTLKRCRVPACTVSPAESVGKVMDISAGGVLPSNFSEIPTVKKYFGSVLPKTMYKYTDSFGLCYIYLSLYGGADSPLLFVGPYLSEPVSSRRVLEIGERMGISPKSGRTLEKLYLGIPVLSEGAHVFVLLDTFCEQLWQTHSFAICNVNTADGMPASVTQNTPSEDNFDEVQFNIKEMEKRYKFENELIRAVSLGQLHKEKLLVSAFSEEMFEKRLSDPLRNAKNYSIIMNTLLRKAAEQGGVHPVYLDRMSSDFAHKIEQTGSLTRIAPLMREMYRSYCLLVRKHSIRDYSITVQKTVLFIDNDLSADLSLSTLAKQQNVSPAYLSALFKKETGKTLSEYIREKRIRYAANLLSTTHLQVQTVALHCGIMDVQYFSKIFKKIMGKTPKEYRALARTQH